MGKSPKKAKAIANSTKDLVLKEVVPAALGGGALTRKDLIQHGGTLLKEAQAEGAYQAFSNLWERLKKSGEVKGEYEKSDQGQQAFGVLMDSLDPKTFDKGRFEALRNIFLNAAQQEPNDYENPEPLALMKIALNLTTEDVIVLAATYRLKQKWSEIEGKYQHWSAANWLTEVAEESKFRHSGLVVRSERRLIELDLLGKRTNSDESGVSMDSNFRLTDIGLALCELMINPEQSK